jgi:hypothetical protein
MTTAYTARDLEGIDSSVLVVQIIYPHSRQWHSVWSARSSKRIHATAPFVLLPTAAETPLITAHRREVSTNKILLVRSAESTKLMIDDLPDLAGAVSAIPPWDVSRDVARHQEHKCGNGSRAGD